MPLFSVFCTLLMTIAFISLQAEYTKQEASKLTYEMLKEMRKDNYSFMKKQKAGYFKAFRDAQHPRATVVGCSDSRAHTHAFDATPDNDIFMVRVIGNQIPNAAGSVEYGVRHLHTPLLMIIGHMGCGAIAAATKGYEDLEPAIKKELEPLMLPIHKKDPTEAELRTNVEANVHHQIEKALKEYKHLIDKEELIVVGAVYDFRNEYGKGEGKLVLININGSKDLKVIQQLEDTIIKYAA